MINQSLAEFRGNVKFDPIYFAIYGLMLLWLSIGLVQYSGVRFWYVLPIHLCGLLVGGAVAGSMMRGARFVRWDGPYLRSFGTDGNNALAFGALVLSCMHWIALGGVPIIDAYINDDPQSVLLIRQHVTSGAASVWNYISSILTLAIWPFVGFLAVLSKKKSAMAFVCMALFYGASLMQKSYVLAVVCPSVIYLVLAHRFRQAILVGALSAVSVWAIVCAMNPTLRPALPSFISVHAAEVVSQKTVDTGWVRVSDVRESVSTSMVGGDAGSLLELNGSTLYYRELSGSWEIGLSPFELSFWIRPVRMPLIGNDVAVFWHGGDSGYGGAVLLSATQDANNNLKLGLTVADREYKNSLTIEGSNYLKVGEWNHVVVRRDAEELFLTINGEVSHARSILMELSPPKGPGIVQFGAIFGGASRRITDQRFQAQIKDIEFAVSRAPENATIEPNSLDLEPRELLTVNKASISSELVEVIVGGASNESGLLFYYKILPPWIAGLLDRAVFIPGYVVAQWLDVIPKVFPHSGVCAYRLSAAMFSCEYVNYPKLVHGFYEPTLVDAGIAGTMNSADFMQGYAAFGLPGVFASGVYIAFILVALGVVFKGRRKVGVALNTSFILYLSSSALPVLLISGGWFVVVFLYICFSAHIRQLPEL